MSEQTPCEKLGYKVGDRFVVTGPGGNFNKGSAIELIHDDASSMPRFKIISGVCNTSRDCDGTSFTHLDRLTKIESDIYIPGSGIPTPPEPEYSTEFIEGQWIVTKDEEPVPLNKIVDILNSKI